MIRRACMLGLLGLASCGTLVEYSDALTEARTGRTEFVMWPATTGSTLGFVCGIPVDVLALPVTWSVHQVQKSSNPGQADLASTVLFPSFVLERTGKILLGAPFDAIEFALYRAWLPPEAMDRETRESIEGQIDEDTLPRYPVQPVFGLPPAQR